MRTKLSTVLVEHFRRWGVTDVFGVPGKSVSPLLFELENQGVNFILSRHEGGAGYEAAGYALTNKTIGVAVGTSGPGGTNLLTAAGQAKSFHLPLLIITGHPPIMNLGKAQGQDSSIFGTDLVRMFEPVTLFSARVDRAELFPAYFRHAIEKACIGTRGPVHLSIPLDVYMEEIESFYMPLPANTSPVISSELESIIPLLDEAKKPVLFLGKGTGISEAYEEVRILAEHWGIPVMTSPGGKGAFPTNHPLSLGAFGLGGTETAKDYVKSGVDLMVVVGTKLSDMTLAGFTPDMYPKQVIQFDVDLTFTGKSVTAPTKAILGDAKMNLRRLIELAGARRKEYGTVPSVLGEGMKTESESNYISSGQAVRALRSQLPNDAILFGDDGSHTYYAIRHYDIYEPGTFFFDDVFGAMGHAIGFAIGAKAGDPNRMIACLTGDGCVMMHGAEISTAVNYRIPVIFVMLNNGRLDMVDKGMTLALGRAVGTVYSTPLDGVRFAQSLGAEAYCCRTEEEIVHAVKASLAAERPVVIEIIVDPYEIPPTTARG